MDSRYVNNTSSEFEKVNRNPIFDYEDLPLQSLEEALECVISDIPRVMDYVKTAKNKCNRSSNKLTLDESAAIYLYSMSSPVYHHLNKVLRTQDCNSLKPWLAFLKLFITALEKLPSITATVWRGVSHDDSLTFLENDIQYWWSVNSCSKAPNIIKPFLGDNGTIFAIDVINGKDISTFSINFEEQEVILMPGSRVRRKNESLTLSDHIILHLEEISSQK
jgi:hypothetical protein